MSLDVGELALKMLKAFGEQLSDKWPEVEDYAKAESKKLAENFVMIERLKLKGEITEEKAKLHHEIQHNASQAVLLAVEGVKLVAVEQAIKAAMDAVKEPINGALGFVLL